MGQEIFFRDEEDEDDEDIERNPWQPPLIRQGKIRARVWAKTGGICWYCGTQTNPFIDFSIDHLIPGIETLENLVPCCSSCNRKKGKYPDLERLRYYLGRKQNISISYSQAQSLKTLGIEVAIPIVFYFETLNNQKNQ